MAGNECLRLGSRNLCVLCSTRIPEASGNTYDTNWDNCFKLLTHYCNIDPLVLFENSNGLRLLRMSYMDKFQKLDQFAFTGMCRECIESGLKFESSFQKMVASKKDFEKAIWNVRHRLMIGLNKNTGQQGTNLDHASAAGVIWRQQLQAQCIPSVEKFLEVFGSIPDSNILELDIPVDPVPASDIVAPSDSTSTASSVVVDDVPKSPDVAMLDNISTSSSSSSSSEEDDDESDSESSSSWGSVDAAIDAHEKSAPVNQRNGVTFKKPNDRAISLPPPPPAIVPFTRSRCLSVVSSEISTSSILTSTRNRRPPQRLTYNEDFSICRRTVMKARCPPKRSATPVPLYDLKCSLCSSRFRRQGEVYFHELLMHPFEKLKEKLPRGTRKKDVLDARDDFIKDVKGKSKVAKSNCYKCLYCDLSYEKSATSLSLLKIHLFKNHFDLILLYLNRTN